MKLPSETPLTNLAEQELSIKLQEIAGKSNMTDTQFIKLFEVVLDYSRQKAQLPDLLKATYELRISELEEQLKVVEKFVDLITDLQLQKREEL